MAEDNFSEMPKQPEQPGRNSPDGQGRKRPRPENRERSGRNPDNRERSNRSSSNRDKADRSGERRERPERPAEGREGSGERNGQRSGSPGGQAGGQGRNRSGRGRNQSQRRPRDNEGGYFRDSSERGTDSGNQSPSASSGSSSGGQRSQSRNKRRNQGDTKQRSGEPRQNSGSRPRNTRSQGPRREEVISGSRSDAVTPGIRKNDDVPVRRNDSVLPSELPSDRQDGGSPGFRHDMQADENRAVSDVQPQPDAAGRQNGETASPVQPPAPAGSADGTDNYRSLSEQGRVQRDDRGPGERSARRRAESADKRENLNRRSYGPGQETVEPAAQAGGQRFSQKPKRSRSVDLLHQLKPEETAADIRLDNEVIEKEIELEIAEIRTVSLD